MNTKQEIVIKLMFAVISCISTLGAQAADQPVLSTAGFRPAAVFTGGATVNDGASFLTSAPASTPLDVVASIIPAAQDIGQTGGLVAVLSIPGLGFFNLQSGGLWVSWNGDAATLKPYRTKTLAAKENVTLLDDLIGSDTNLTGLTFQAYVGYYTGNSVATISYSATPVAFSIANPASGCPTNTSSISGSFAGKPVCVLSGRINKDTHLTANNSYLLNGAVFIGESIVAGNKTKLTIDAGTTVFSQQGLNFLVIDRNGQIFANGSKKEPIVFTYEGEATATPTTSGQWGGIIINGSAPINVAGGTAEGEGSTGIYGGNNATDNSGSLTYVQVKYAGQNITPTNELNGIAFQAVGSGTIVDYVQVHNNSDDGVEFFGGTVNAKHLVLTGNEDDSLDWTFGWNGKVQHVVVKQTGGRGDLCIEGDNNDTNNDAMPRANPTIANMTCIGKGNNGVGLRLRQGTSAHLAKFVVTGFNQFCVDLDQTATFTNAGSSLSTLNGNLQLRNSRLDSACNFENETGEPFTASGWFAAQTGSSLGVVDLGGARGWANGSALNAISVGASLPAFFDATNYIGAIKDDSSDWTAGWTVSP